MPTLHSTMFLLIHLTASCLFLLPPFFTFHYVSINTTWESENSSLKEDFTFHYVSINTMLSTAIIHIRNAFTFHYVSINTRSSEPPINSSILYHILSTMIFFYLFIYLINSVFKIMIMFFSN